MRSTQSKDLQLLLNAGVPEHSRVGGNTLSTGASSASSCYDAEKMSNESSIRHGTIGAGRIAWLLCTVLSLLALTTLAVIGMITPRIFGWLCLLIMIASGVVLYRLLRTAVAVHTPTNSNPKLNWRKRWYILAAGLLWLILALWMTRGGPWLPRLVGASFVVLLIIGNMTRKAR
jgi:hypothetical protein